MSNVDLAGLRSCTKFSFHCLLPGSFAGTAITCVGIRVNPIAVAAIARNFLGLAGIHFVSTLNTAVFFDSFSRSERLTFCSGAGSVSPIPSDLMFSCSPLFPDLGSNSTSFCSSTGT